MKKKILIGIGSFAAMATPTIAVVSCSPWDKPKHKAGYDLNKMDEKSWHTIFHVNGKSLPPVNTVFKVSADNEYTYTWVEGDNTAKTPAAYKAGTKNQTDIINYLVAKLAGDGATTAVRQKIFDSLDAIASSPHGIKFDPNFVIEKSITPDKPNEGTKDESMYVSKDLPALDLTGEGLSAWEKILGTEQNRMVPRINQKIKITVGSKSYVYEITNADIGNTTILSHWNLRNVEMSTAIDVLLEKIATANSPLTKDQLIAVLGDDVKALL